MGSALTVTSIHSGSANSHIGILSAAEAGEALHTRLHLSASVIRRLPKCSADAPEVLCHCPKIACGICTEANVSFSSSSNHPSSKPSRTKRPGQLVYADIAGPLVCSASGAHQYALVFVDDHSRYKWVYFMRKKSEAPAYVRTFIASFNSLLSNRYGADEEFSVAALHTDNAGEFFSKEFAELLDKDQVAQSTCPPHVHALNGVAERAIRSIFNHVRSNMVASGVKASLWPHLVRHSLDTLNRTTGPEVAPTSGPFQTAFELLAGEKPRIMGIMPFGCRAYAVKPRESFSKSRLDARAWVGYNNLGRSRRSHGAYEIFIPSLRRNVTTAQDEVYFDETLMPLREPGDQRVGSVVPVLAPKDDTTGAPVGIPQANDKTSRATIEERSASLREALAQATKRESAHASRKVLALFSGPYNRPDGLGCFLTKLGLEPVMVDNDSKRGGDIRHDILNDSFFQSMIRRVALGEFLAIIAVPPCSTFSIARCFQSKDSPEGGPPPVRNRNNIMGFPEVPRGHEQELRNANELIRRMSILPHVATGAGTEFIVENPADRGDRDQPQTVNTVRFG